MSVSGACEACGTARARHGCDRCGRLVCDRHYDEETGLCTDCAARGGRGRGRQDDDWTDGVDTHRM